MGKPPDVDSVCGKLSDQWILGFVPCLAHDGVWNLGLVQPMPLNLHTGISVTFALCNLLVLLR